MKADPKNMGSDPGLSYASTILDIAFSQAAGLADSCYIIWVKPCEVLELEECRFDVLRSVLLITSVAPVLDKRPLSRLRSDDHIP